MKFRTLALALALSCGATTMVQAATHKPAKTKPAKAKHVKTKQVKMQKSKRYKQSKASTVKPHKPAKRK